jgi:histidine triad (HIT) family protein
VSTLFSKILAGEIPADVVYEDEHAFAFRDINPVAPTHVLVIPRREIVNVGSASEGDGELLGHLMLAAAKVAKLEGLEDFRVVTNSGAGAGQSVFHLHLHVIGGRELGWPPG